MTTRLITVKMPDVNTLEQMMQRLFGEEAFAHTRLDPEDHDNALCSFGNAHFIACRIHDGQIQANSRLSVGRGYRSFEEPTRPDPGIEDSEAQLENVLRKQRELFRTFATQLLTACEIDVVMSQANPPEGSRDFVDFVPYVERLSELMFGEFVEEIKPFPHSSKPAIVVMLRGCVYSIELEFDDSKASSRSYLNPGYRSRFSRVKPLFADDTSQKIEEQVFDVMRKQRRQVAENCRLLLRRFGESL